MGYLLGCSLQLLRVVADAGEGEARGLPILW